MPDMSRYQKVVASVQSHLLNRVVTSFTVRTPQVWACYPFGSYSALPVRWLDQLKNR